jgi:hypothetical protein
VAHRITGKPRARLRAAPALLALSMASSCSTAKADPPTATNIPASEQKDLPLPYEAWSGTGLAPPSDHATPDLPPPLARPREHARRQLEVVIGAASFLPSCGSGSIDDRGCLTVTPGSGVDAALLYRVGPFFAVGAEGALSGFAAPTHGLLSGAGGGARFFGVVGRVYFADAGAWDPYVSLTLGAGTLVLRAPNAARESTSGVGGRVGGGIDYVASSHLRVGPTASFAHWVAWSEARCSGDACRDEPAAYGRLLGFATLGLRLTGTFGDVL